MEKNSYERSAYESVDDMVPSWVHLNNRRKTIRVKSFKG